MTRTTLRPLMIPALAAVIGAFTCAAAAQDADQPVDRPPAGLFDKIFGSDDNAAPSGQQHLAQGPASDLSVRIDRLEGQIRQMTGTIEQLQYHNQQLEAQVRRMQEDDEYRFQELGSKGAGGRPAATPVPSRPSSAAAPIAPSPVSPPPAAAAPGRRGDAFDPNANPTAPGAPRALGAVPPGAEPPPPVASPGGRAAGAPLNLSSAVSGEPPPLAPPSGDSGAAGAQVATLPPADTPKDQFDLAYGYIVRHDYALADDGFRAFLQKYPTDTRAADAQFWLGESLFQRQRYRDAAEAFLAVSNKYDGNAKAPDALLRLGQSLAALGEREMACATFGEVGRKYPRAPTGLKQGVDREQKRVHC